MSYIRAGHELTDFEGESNLYVFSYNTISGYTFVEDYDSLYNENASLAQLIINMMRRLFKEEGFTDEAYISRMKEVLAEKLRVKAK